MNWLKKLFTKKIKVKISNNYTNYTDNSNNDKAYVNTPYIATFYPKAGYKINFVKIFRKEVADKNEILNHATYNNDGSATINYIPVKSDKQIILWSSASEIEKAPVNIHLSELTYEIRCDYFQNTFLSNGEELNLNPYVLVSEFTNDGRKESVIRYNDDPENFKISVDNVNYVLNGDRLTICPNYSGIIIPTEVNICYKDICESNQIYQE